MALTNRYTGIAQGSMVLTGNAISCRVNQDYPPATGNALYTNGQFITTDTLKQVPGYPVGTTTQYLENSAMAILDVPSGSTVLFAQLMWVVRFAPAGTEGNSVNFTTPAGATTVSPTLSEFDTVYSLYWKAADVKNLVQAGIDTQHLNGQYFVGAVPGPNNPNGQSACTSWGLVVVYQNNTLPYRYFDVNTGVQLVSNTDQLIFNFTSFKTPSQGDIKGYLLVNASYGDLDDKAQVRVGSASPGTQIGNSSYPWNTQAPYSRINNMLPANILIADTRDPDIGKLDTRGTFGNYNVDPYGNGGLGAAPASARVNYDIAGLDISNQLTNSQTNLYTNVTFVGTGSALVHSESVQVDINSANIQATKTVDKSTAYIGDTVLYTITMNNIGAVDAQNVGLTDIIPSGLVFVNGSVVIGVTPSPGDVPASGISIGTIAAGGSQTVTFNATADSVPAINPAINSAKITYIFESIQGQPLINASTTTNDASTLVSLSASIVIRVFDDANHNGEWDIGEQGIPNAYVVVRDPSQVCTKGMTDNLGIFTLPNVIVTGTYTVYEPVQDPGSTCPPTIFVQPLGYTDSSTIRITTFTVTTSDIESGTTYTLNYGHDNPPTIPCSTTVYQVYSSGGNSTFAALNLVTGIHTTINPNIDVQAGAIGYNTTNSLIYGVISSSATLIRIIANGIVAFIGRIPNLPIAAYTVAAVDSSQHLFLSSGNNANYYVVDINQNSATFGQLLDPTAGYILDTAPYGTPMNPVLPISDWVINPIDNQLYAINDTTGQVVSINPTNGTATNIATSGIPTGIYGSIFVNSNGTLYGYDDSSGQIYRVLVSGTTATGSLFSTSNILNFSDGAGCSSALIEVDFGDAPDTSSGSGANDYSTLLVNNGPRHQILGSLKLGTQVTAEADAYQNPTATGDDIPLGIQDDGIILPVPDIQASLPTYSFNVIVTNETTTTANLYSWVDFNSNGIFEGSEAATVIQVPPGTITVTPSFIVPPNVQAAYTFIRVRLTTDNLVNSNNSPSQLDTRSIGPASDGEVEDYLVQSSVKLDVQIVLSAAPDTVRIGDTITYTSNICNLGSIQITDAIFKCPSPAGTVYIQNSFMINGTVQLGANPSVGVVLGNYSTGQCVVVSFSVRYVAKTCCQKIGCYCTLNFNYRQNPNDPIVNKTIKSNMVYTNKVPDVMIIQ